MHTSSLPKFAQQKIKQLVYKDLFCQEFDDLYFQHTQILVSWLTLFGWELNLARHQRRQLILAGYGYNWGCGNLHQHTHKHNNPTLHTDTCFLWAAVKLERLLSYHFSQILSQQDLLQTVALLEEQASVITVKQGLSSLLDEAAWLVWQQLYIEDDLCPSWSQLKRQDHSLPQLLKQKKLTLNHTIMQQAWRAVADSKN